MNASDAVTVYAGLYGPQKADMLAGLPDLADKLRAQVLALYEAPSEHRAEDLARSLSDARVATMRLADALRREWVE